MNEVQENSEALRHKDDDTMVSGDELYKLMGFDTIDSISNNIYLAPSIGGEPIIPAYRIVLKFSSDEMKTVERILPLDELLTTTTSLIDCFEVETLRKSARSIALLNMRESKLPITTIDKAISGLQELRIFLTEVSLNNFDIDDQS